MQQLGFRSLCNFPNTGINCTELSVDKISPALEYTRVIGMVTYIILMIPSLSLTRSIWREYRAARGKAGTGLRLVGAFGNISGGLFSIVLFATGQVVTYSASGLVGLFSFISLAGCNISYAITTCSIVLIARRLFLATILFQIQAQKTIHNNFHKAKESQIVLVSLGPAVGVYSTTTVLALTGVVVDNIILGRINSAGLLLYVCSTFVLTRIYGWPVVKALSIYAAAINAEAAPETQGQTAVNRNQRAIVKVQELADKLAAQLKMNERGCFCFFFVFGFLTFSNVLSIPQVNYGICLWCFNVVFPLQHMSHIWFLKKNDQSFFVGRTTQKHNKVTPTKLAQASTHGSKGSEGVSSFAHQTEK